MIDIMILPNDALLNIFGFFVDHKDRIEAWHPLVHVCRKWRNIVFGSPRRLNLHIRCAVDGPQALGELLDIWPDLPIVITLYEPPTSSPGVDKIVAVAAASESLALAHTNRVVCDISLGMYMVVTSPLQVIFAAMQVASPASIRLKFLPEHEAVPIAAPDDPFLDGFSSSSPHLRSLYLGRVPFPGLPKPLLFATDLVRLTMHDIPPSWYISPEAMVACLSVLTSLESLRLGFEFPRPRHVQERRRLPQQTFSALPALTHFSFRGVSEYLEDLVARIDGPFLNELCIAFFHQLVLKTPELAQFISRAPNLKAVNEVHLVFLDDAVQVLLGSMQQISILTACKALDWQLSFVTQVCNSSLSLIIPSLEHLYIREDKTSQSRWPDDVENSQWLDILGPFTNVKNLYLSGGVVPRIAPALQELVEGRRSVAEVLPNLERLYLEEPHPGLGTFIYARQLSEGHGPTNSRNWEGRRTSEIGKRFTGHFD